LFQFFVKFTTSGAVYEVENKSFKCVLWVLNMDIKFLLETMISGYEK